MIRFQSSLEHILVELTRLDVVLRVQAWRVQQGQKSLATADVAMLLDKIMGQPLWATMPLSEKDTHDIQVALSAMAENIKVRKATSLQAGMVLRLESLATYFELTRFDLDVILVCLAPEVDLGYGKLYGQLQGRVETEYPTMDLAFSLLCSTITERVVGKGRLARDAPLLVHGLVDVVAPAGQTTPRLGHFLRLDDRIRDYLLDGDTVDVRLQSYVTCERNTVGMDDVLLPAGIKQKLLTILDKPTVTLYLEGVYGIGKHQLAKAIASHTHRPLLVVNGAQLSKLKLESFAALAQLVDREARLQEAVLYWSGFEALLTEEKAFWLERLLEIWATRPGITILGGDMAWHPAGAWHNKLFIHIPIPLPTYPQRIQQWQTQLGTDIPITTIQELANKFQFTLGQVADVSSTVQNITQWEHPQSPTPTKANLYTASRHHASRKLSQLAEKITSPYTWSDLVLPPHAMAHLREISRQVQYRGRVLDEWGFGNKLSMGTGLHALFTGPSGTGKTMAASIIANELGLDLYRIDLSTVVSKYIGETEKNLADIFREAETSHAILFFDEADALFGKRTEVKDAHDRYANLEVSYLLQRMEAYKGITVLASNLRQNLDDAFVRRIHFIVTFPVPDIVERERIWRQIWPKDTPIASNVDMAFLAERITVTGGNIRNIALAAAYLAANEVAVSNKHIFRAAEREYQKIGKLLTGNEFQ